ncbi:MAG TPA: hypothetical protein VFR62_10040, partial [Gemmatimonadales bacterium]|nr:hypothetical protein [Gemmatimonadales bacterium]
LVPSHGAVRLVEAPAGREGNRTLSLWVPDCLAPETITAIRYGEVTGDLPRDLGTEEYQGSRDPIRGCESLLPDAVPYTGTRPAHYYTPGGHRVWFVVSLLTAMALRGREDVVTRGPEVRTTEGRIVGCFGLRRVV